MAFVLRRFGPAFILGGTIAVAIGNIATGLMPSEQGLAAVRAITALFGEGPLLAYSFVVLGKMKRPERGFAVALAAAVICGTAAIQPALEIGSMGDGASLAIYTILTIPTALLLVIVLRWPHTISMRGILERASAPMLDVSNAAKSSFITRLLIGQLIWAAAPGIFWPFAAQYAHQAGAKEADIIAAFSIANIVGLMGAVGPAIAGSRVGYHAGIIAGSAGLAIAAFSMSFSTNVINLTACFAAFIIFWSVGQIYQPALLVASDRSGRSAALVPVVQLAGLAAGTAIGGFVIRALEIQALPMFCIVAVAIATPLFFIMRPGKRVAVA